MPTLYSMLCFPLFSFQLLSKIHPSFFKKSLGFNPLQFNPLRVYSEISPINFCLPSSQTMQVMLC